MLHFQFPKSYRQGSVNIQSWTASQKAGFHLDYSLKFILSRRKIPFWMLPRNLYNWFRNKHLYMNFNSEFISCYYKVIVSPHENMKHEKKKQVSTLRDTQFIIFFNEMRYIDVRGNDRVINRPLHNYSLFTL